jgi:rhodanese-related sulfurtransferase
MRVYLTSILVFLSGMVLFAQTVPYRNLSAAQADTLIRNHAGSGDLVLLDVRTKTEHITERIEKSSQLDILASNPFNDSIEKLDRNKIYLVYCATGSRSPGASTRMQNKGFRSVYHLTGGIVSWKREGLPTVKGTASGMDLNMINNLIVKIYPNPVVDLSTLEIQGFVEGEVRIEILNALGSVVLSRKMVPGRAITLNAAELSPGLYFYRLVLPENQVKSGRFQVAR